ncbi:ATP-binding SpoIIE family protein phosphatase [Glaciecola petra]|uniref:SpoIIE family protein phosphatase n=1 Tax=Glaciecola petra TaxID=3075602 RepID=A0ABU2ZRG7_9ALTE|nr:SpoIIE family protein phosphatase [Aestuariibacter sp. P117]MDT0595231.1 SpoIIE family protein phosphatase [Aestuariibacter sp. P117]
MRILVVEDDNLFGEIIDTFLSSNECVVDLAQTLAVAKSQIKDTEYDFILLDNNLPDGSGITAIKHFKQHAKIDTPIMMITADENQNVMVEAFESGIDDFLVKPLSLDLLWQKLLRVHSNFQKAKKLSEQTKRLEAMVNQQKREEALARYMYEHLSANLQQDSDHITTYLQSSSAFNGDFFISDTAPNGNKLIFLADATGHGLSAAISIIPLINTMRAMLRKSLPLAHIIHEANKKMCSDLPDDKFVAVIGLEINPHDQSIDIFNGGMPDIIALNEDKSLVHYPSTSMSLGIMEPEDFDPGISSISAKNIRNLFFFSDGLIEQENNNGEAFGMSRLLDILSNWDYQEHLVSRVVNYFTVFNELLELQDDLSLCDVQVADILSSREKNQNSNAVKKTGSIIASLTLQGEVIAATDVIGVFDALMHSADMVGDLRQRAFTVFAELISNALDHGILDLDSDLKNDVAGFADYIELKEKRLANMEDTDKLEMTLEYQPETEEIAFSIKDSGKGYDAKSSSSKNELALSGRGMPLINKLCKQVEVIAPGNFTSVTIKREM